MMYRKFIRLATGGKNKLLEEHLEILKNRSAFPFGEPKLHEQWQKFTANFIYKNPRIWLVDFTKHVPVRNIADCIFDSLLPSREKTAIPAQTERPISNQDVDTTTTPITTTLPQHQIVSSSGMVDIEMELLKCLWGY